MNKNGNNYEDSEYVFVQFESSENQIKGKNMMPEGTKGQNCLDFTSSGYDCSPAPAHIGVDDHNGANDDDNFSLSSFDLCDEELAIDTSDAEMKLAEEDDGSLHLSQSPSVASVCTETMFDTIKDQDGNAGETSKDGTASQEQTAKNSRPRSVSNANSTASTSSNAGNHSSRLSNKKRRKQVKQQKKAAAAAAAAEALASQSPHQTKVLSPKPIITVVPNAKIKSNATSIAVLCATQSLAQYRQEVGLINVKGSGTGSALNKPNIIERPTPMC
jgi:hypothetical protein